MIEILLIMQLSLLERANHIVISSSIIAHGVDLSTSSYAFGKSEDFKEKNPILRWSTDDPVKFGLAKIGLAVGLNYALVRYHKDHPKFVLIMAITQTVAIGYIAHRNAELVRNK